MMVSLIRMVLGMARNEQHPCLWKKQNRPDLPMEWVGECVFRTAPGFWPARLAEGAVHSLGKENLKRPGLEADYKFCFRHIDIETQLQCI